MEEIPFGEMVRVRKAIRILQRKNLKPLSSNLNKILCKPLRQKSTMFPPPPFPDNPNGAVLRRSRSHSSLKNIPKPSTANQHPTLNITKTELSEGFELKNPMISPGVDKKKSFNEMKFLLSPALRNSLPKLNKPELSTMNEKLNFNDEPAISDRNNQSFFSQTSKNNFCLKNLLKQSDSTTNARNLKEKGKGRFFFPEEEVINTVRSEQKKQTSETIKPKKFQVRGKSVDAKLSLRIKLVEEKPIPPQEKPLKENKTTSNSFQNSVNGETAKKFQRKEISNKIARNLVRLKSMPVITKRLPGLLNHEATPHNSDKVSFSVDFQISFNRHLPKSNNSSFSVKESQDPQLNKKIFKKNTFDLGETKILSSRFDFQDSYLAIACEDSIIRVFNTQSNTNKLEYFLKDNNNMGIATTCVRWKPKTFQKVLLSTQATGVVTIWDVQENEILQQIEEDNYVYTSDFNNQGTLFATGGSDTKIRIYDLEKKAPISFLMNQEDNPGHSNRVYNVLFNPEDPNILFSGGWDGNIFIWDLRTGESVHYISGPMICGDSMDLRGNELLTGSWRNDNQIEIWDLRTSKLLINVPWVPDQPDEKSFIYSCKFSKATKNYIIAGSTGKCELRVFDKRYDYKNIDSDKEFNYGIFSLDFKYLKDEFVCGSGEGKINSYFIR